MNLLLVAAVALVPWLTQTGTGVVAGRIHFTDGASVAGVRTALMQVPASGKPSTEAVLVSIGLTGADGSYRLEKVPPGRYYVVIGRVDSPVFFPGVIAPADARIVTVPAGGTVDVNFDLESKLLNPRAVLRSINTPRTRGTFDQSRQITIEGKIVSFTVRNPNSLIEIEVVEGARTRTWELTWAGVTELAQSGISRFTLKYGEIVRVTGLPAPANSPALWILNIVRPKDGWVWGK